MFSFGCTLSRNQIDIDISDMNKVNFLSKDNVILFTLCLKQATFVALVAFKPKIVRYLLEGIAHQAVNS